MKINISVNIGIAHRVWAIYFLLKDRCIYSRSKPINKRMVLSLLRSKIKLFGINRDFLMGEIHYEISDYLNGKIGNNGILKEAIRLEYDLFQKDE